MDDENEELCGNLHIKSSLGGCNKIKNSKKLYWVKLEREHNQLFCYKNSKELETPHEKLNLHGAGVSFGNASDNEFIINIRGCEFTFNADNHRSMMLWANSLKRQSKIKPLLQDNVQHLQSVPEDEVLKVEENKPKRKSFFNRLLHRLSNRSRGKKDTSAEIPDDNHVVKPAPLRTVVGSMQDISSKTAKCAACENLEGRNIYLSEQVKQLNEDVENLKDQIRSNVRCTEIMENKQTRTNLDFVNFIQHAVSQDCTEYTNLKEISGSLLILQIIREELERNSSLPTISESTTEELEHVDHFGFQHLKRDTPQEKLLYLCELLKKHFNKLLQTDDDNFHSWQFYAASVKQDTNVLVDRKFKALVNKRGIPHEFRSRLWKQMIENNVASLKEEKGADYYANIVKKLPDFETCEEPEDGTLDKQIKIDLLRTMPTHVDYQNFTQPKVLSLHRVLRAFVIHNAEVGYCQGMNFMVAFGLLYLDEETAFWMLIAITEVYFNRQHYNMYLSGTQASQRVFDTLCKEELPTLHQHLEALGCELTPVTFNWFMTIFYDALPTQVVLCIWDCFLCYGHMILYPFALGLLKLQQGKLLACRDTLSAMRQLKIFGKLFYDSNSLLQTVFVGGFEGLFAKYSDLYEEHRLKIEEETEKRKLEDTAYEKRKEKLKFTPKQMMVSVSENLDELDDDLLIKCVECEVNRNYVWMLCSSDLMGQVFVLNVASRNTVPIAWQVDCKCIAMCRLSSINAMLISTFKSSLHAIDIETRKEIWMVQLAGAALSITCDDSGNVALTLMDGAIAFFNIKEKRQEIEPTYLDISRVPIFSGYIIDEHFWCGAANKIVVMQMRTLESSASMKVCPNDKHTISQLFVTDIGVWSSVINSSVVHLWHKKQYSCLLTVDILVESGLASEKKTCHLLDISISTLMFHRNKLWVGFGNGRFIINDVVPRCDEDDDLNDAINQFKNNAGSLSPIKVQNGRLGVITCCHDIPGDELHMNENRNSTISVGEQHKRISQMERPAVEYTLKMNQIQRVSEDRVNCFIPCRNDNRLVLSCMGALNDDSSVILWSSEKHEGREMWFAQTVSYSE